MEDFEKIVIASDYVPHDGFSDAADAIQRLIDEHPNRTIYFPDGTYLLSHPVLTPANSKCCVSLHLADYAVLKASDNWTGSEAMIRLGAKNPADDIDTNGSNYRLSGGIITGNYHANGVSVDGGRETIIADVSFANMRIAKVFTVAPDSLNARHKLRTTKMVKFQNKKLKNGQVH